MAANVISIPVVGYNGNICTTKTVLVNTFGGYADDVTYNVTGANATYYMLLGAGSNQRVNWQTSLTVTQLNDLLNADQVVDLTVVDTLTIQGNLIDSVETGITAHAGGGQGSAYALTLDYNNVTVCATAGDSVVLLPAAKGLIQTVKNNGSTNLAVFPNTGDTINSGSANASVTLVPKAQVRFTAINTTDWESAEVSNVTSISLGTDIIGLKEVDHQFYVTTTTTAATPGGAISITGGIGATTGAGGAVSITGGVGGATAASVGGAITFKSGISGAGNGASGVVTIESGAATAAATGAVILRSGIPATSGNSGTLTLATGSVTTANSGALSLFTGVSVTGNSGALTIGTGATTTGNSSNVTISTGNAGTGNSGDIVLTPGTGSAVVGKIVMSNAVTNNHKTAAVNSTATITAKQAATGYITTTSAATVTATLPTGTLLGAELNAAQGTVHRLYFDNTAGSNVLTIAVAVNGILSALAAAVGASAGLLTVPSGVTGLACFELVFSSSTAYAFTRVV